MLLPLSSRFHLGICFIAYLRRHLMVYFSCFACFIAHAQRTMAESLRHRRNLPANQTCLAGTSLLAALLYPQRSAFSTYAPEFAFADMRARCASHAAYSPVRTSLRRWRSRSSPRGVSACMTLHFAYAGARARRSNVHPGGRRNGEEGGRARRWRRGTWTSWWHGGTGD
jgi:hypothetical protein